MEETKEHRAFKTLIKVLEEMLFSIPMPIEVIKKYEFMRESATSKTNVFLPPSKIWALQRTALERSKIDKQGQADNSDLTAQINSQVETIARYAEALRQQMDQYEKVMTRLDGISSESRVNHLNQRIRFSPAPRSTARSADLTQDIGLEDFRDIIREKDHHADLVLDSITQALNSQEEKISTIETDAERLKLQYKTETETLLTKLEKLSTQSASEEAFEAERQVLEAERFNLLKEKERNLQKLTDAQDQIDQLKKDNDLTMQVRREDLQREVDLIKSEHAAEIEKLKAKFQLELEDVHNTYRNEIDVNESMNKSHLSAIEEARSEYRHRERELESKLERVTTEDSALLKEFRTRLEGSQAREAQFKEVIAAIQDKTNPIYVKHAAVQKDWVDEIPHCEGIGSEALLEVDFVCYLLEKLENDNAWLVERLSDFGKENETLRSQSQMRESPVRTASPAQKDLRTQVLQEMQQTSKAMKEFEIARDRLLENFEKGNDSFSISESILK